MNETVYSWWGPLGNLDHSITKYNIKFNFNKIS